MQFIEFPSDMIQKEDKDTSIYQYRKGYNLQFESESIIYGRKEVYESVMDKVTIGEYSIIEIEIIKILFRFKWLNRKNIERYLNNSPNINIHMRKPNYETNLKNLRKDGVIVTFSRAPVFAGEETKIIVYRLSEGAYDYANAFLGVRKTYNKEKENMTIDTATALEILSLNQWYITMLIGGQFKKTWYRQRFASKKGPVMVDAAFRLEVDKNRYGSKTMMLYAFALSKKEDGYVKFINHLLNLNAYIQSSDNKYKLSLILVTCESRKRMTEAYAALKGFHELDELELLFILDEDSLSGTGLENVYICEYNPDVKDITYFRTDVSLFKKVEQIEDPMKEVEKL